MRGSLTRMNNQNLDTLPIGITLGCPASIGPELIVKYHFLIADDPYVPVVVIGDKNVVKKISTKLNLPVRICDWHPGMHPAPDSLNLYSVSDLDPNSFSFGTPTPGTSTAMAAYVEKAIEFCLNGTIRAMVTCPISKSSLNQAGYDFPGHTELLARRTGASEVAMMLTGDTLKVVPATIHCALSEVAENLNSEDLISQIHLTEDALREDFAIEKVRIGVAGLNPHAGEDGLFGSEEQTIIAPAIEAARATCDPRTTIGGPYPPDTIFYNARSGLFDVVISMYHDQGLIPFKLVHFEDGVNVTLGLPIVRTSVDHGTAYDIAGQGIGKVDSLKAAIRLADVISTNRTRTST